MQICFDTSGASDMLRPGAWGGGGGGGGAAYAAGAAASAPSVNLKELLNDAVDSVETVAEVCWEAYVHSNELEMQMQYERDMAVVSFWEDTFRSPARTGDFVSMTISNISTYCAYTSFVAAPTVCGAVLLIAGIGSCIWSTLRYFDTITE